MVVECPFYNKVVEFLLRITKMHEQIRISVSTITVPHEPTEIRTYVSLLVSCHTLEGNLSRGSISLFPLSMSSDCWFNCFFMNGSLENVYLPNTGHNILRVLFVAVSF